MSEAAPEQIAARERDQLLRRLAELRAIVPAFATELASARRQAARLRVENGRLIKQVERVQREHRGRASHARAPLRSDAIGTSRRKLAG